MAEPELWPALAESVARQVERALRPGVLQGYVTLDEALPLVRGRSPGRRPDGAAAGLAVAARSPLRRVRAGYPGEPAHPYRLAAHARRCQGCGLNSGLGWPIWMGGWMACRCCLPARPGRLAAHQAQRPLRGGAATGGDRAAEPVGRAWPGQGHASPHSWCPWRRCSRISSRSRCARPSRLPSATPKPSIPSTWPSRQIPIRPDVVHLVGGRPVAVFDAKYKLEEPSSGYPNADIYQMLAYCTALQLELGWLVYAQGERAARRPAFETPRSRSSSTHSTWLHHPADLLRQVDRLAGSALGLTWGAASAMTAPVR